MDPVRTQKIISLFERGVVTAPELANYYLYELVSEPELDTAFLASIGSLPEGVSGEMVELLRRIQSANYLWIPFLIGPGNTTAVDSARLRRICKLLGVGE